MRLIKKQTDKISLKELNRSISSFRVLVEHAIGGAKRCRIVKDRFRCGKFGFDDLVMQQACELYNFRIALNNTPHQP